MVLTLLGLNYKSASLETLEKLSHNEEKVLCRLQEFSAEKNIRESIILSTCNRFEIYAVHTDSFNLKEYLSEYFKNLLNIKLDKQSFYILKDDDAVMHLFKVSAGLDSMVLGESQIAGQLKKAYTLACDAGTSDKYLNKLLPSAFRVSKRIRNETLINKGASSFGFATIEAAKKKDKKFY